MMNPTAEKLTIIDISIYYYYNLNTEEITHNYKAFNKQKFVEDKKAMEIVLNNILSVRGEYKDIKIPSSDVYLCDKIINNPLSINRELSDERTDIYVKVAFPEDLTCDCGKDEAFYLSTIANHSCAASKERFSAALDYTMSLLHAQCDNEEKEETFRTIKCTTEK